MGNNHEVGLARFTLMKVRKKGDARRAEPRAAPPPPMLGFPTQVTIQTQAAAPAAPPSAAVARAPPAAAPPAAVPPAPAAAPRPPGAPPPPAVGPLPAAPPPDAAPAPARPPAGRPPVRRVRADRQPLTKGQRINRERGVVEFNPDAIPPDVSPYRIGFFLAMDEIPPGGYLPIHSISLGMRGTGGRIGLQLALALLLHLEWMIVFEDIRPNTRHKPCTHLMKGFCIWCGEPIFFIYLDRKCDDIFVQIYCMCPCGICQEIFTPFDCGRGMKFWSMDLQAAYEELNNTKQEVFCTACRQLAHWTKRQKRLQDGFLWDWMHPRMYSAAARRRLKLLTEHCENLEDFIDHLGGHVKVIVADETDEGPVSEYVYHGCDVVALIWIPEWAVAAYERCSYVQLDCSFRATRPFTYGVPQAMIHNTAVPLGFVMAPRESQFTYATFMEELELYLPKGELEKHPVLSDQHLGLIAFCKSHNIRQFFCHRHLIQKWGAKSAAGLFVAQVLRIQTAAQFGRLLPQFKDDLAALVDKKLMTKKTSDDIWAWLTTDYHDGIWERVELGMARCSNHAEHFHGMVNEKLEKNRTLPLRLKVIVKIAMARYGAYSNAWEGQVKYALGELRKKNETENPGCQCEECLAYRHMMEVRFDLVDFPCAHTLVGYTPHLRRERPGLRNEEYERKVRAHHGGTPETVDVSTIINNPKFTARERRHLARELVVPQAIPGWRPQPRDVVAIDEESGPEKHADQRQPGTPYYEEVRLIVAGVCGMRARCTQYLPVDELGCSGLIFTHYKEQFAAQGFRQGDDASVRKWLGQYKAAWWHWAATDTDLPTAIPLIDKLPDQFAEIVDGDVRIRVDMELP